MLAACSSTESTRLAREMDAQTRVFDTPDRTRMLQAVVGTLYDLSFAIDDVDLGSGKVNASTHGDYQLNMVVSVVPSGDKRQTLVRLEAYLVYDPAVLKTPQTYRIFFAALGATSELEPRDMCDVSVPPDGPIKDTCEKWFFSNWLFW